MKIIGSDEIQEANGSISGEFYLILLGAPLIKTV